MRLHVGFVKAIGLAVVGSAICSSAQVVASHAPTLTATKPVAGSHAASPAPAPSSPGNPVARVNGAVLTEEDLAREVVHRRVAFPRRQD